MNDEGEALLSDFGLSRIRHEDNRTRTLTAQGGTYLAPELFDGAFDTTRETDCYSFGIMVHELGKLKLVTLGCAYVLTSQLLMTRHCSDY